MTTNATTTYTVHSLAAESPWSDLCSDLEVRANDELFVFTVTTCDGPALESALDADPDVVGYEADEQARNATAPRNTKAAHCSSCGVLVQPGEGIRWYQAAPDDGGDVVNRTPAGWRVTHADKAKCGIENEVA